MSVTIHKQQQNHKISCSVITISDSRTKETDKSGKVIIEKLQKYGHEIVSYQIVKDDSLSISQAIRKEVNDPKVEAVFTNGGTGISKRDVTIETIKPMLDKELVGFGEIFRMLSYYEDIGSAAIMSRAIAGVINERAIFATPGSTGAVKLAFDKIILLELAHIRNELNKQK